MYRTMTIATAAMLALTGAPTMAQDAAPAGDTETARAEIDWSQMIRTRDMTGGAVYTTNEAHDEGSWGGNGEGWGWSDYDQPGADWNEIGEIEDVVLNRSGELAGMVVEIGGFLDIGDKHVFLAVEDLELIADGEDDYTLVTRYSEEQLEDLPGVDEGWWE